MRRIKNLGARVEYSSVVALIVEIGVVWNHLLSATFFPSRLL